MAPFYLFNTSTTLRVWLFMTSFFTLIIPRWQQLAVRLTKVFFMTDSGVCRVCKAWLCCVAVSVSSSSTRTCRCAGSWNISCSLSKLCSSSLWTWLARFVPPARLWSRLYKHLCHCCEYVKHSDRLNLFILSLLFIRHLISCAITANHFISPLFVPPNRVTYVQLPVELQSAGCHVDVSCPLFLTCTSLYFCRPTNSCSLKWTMFRTAFLAASRGDSSSINNLWTAFLLLSSLSLVIIVRLTAYDLIIVPPGPNITIEHRYVGPRILPVKCSHWCASLMAKVPEFTFGTSLLRHGNMATIIRIGFFLN